MQNERLIVEVYDKTIRKKIDVVLFDEKATLPFVRHLKEDHRGRSYWDDFLSHTKEERAAFELVDRVVERYLQARERMKMKG